MIMHGESRIDEFLFSVFLIYSIETIYVILYSNDIGDGGVVGRE